MCKTLPRHTETHISTSLRPWCLHSTAEWCQQEADLSSEPTSGISSWVWEPERRACREWWRCLRSTAVRSAPQPSVCRASEGQNNKNVNKNLFIVCASDLSSELLTFGAILLTISEMSTTPTSCFLPLLPDNRIRKKMLVLFDQKIKQRKVSENVKYLAFLFPKRLQRLICNQYDYGLIYSWPTDRLTV